MNTELVQMFVAPVKGHLQYVAQIRNRTVTSHQQAPPDPWSYLQNPHMKQVDFNLALGVAIGSQFSEPPSRRSKAVRKTSGQSFSPRIALVSVGGVCVSSLSPFPAES